MCGSNIVHATRDSIIIVRAALPNPASSRFDDILLHPWSRDLSMYDFYIWGHLKSRVYEGKSRSLATLKSAIRDRIEEIAEETLERKANFQERFKTCIGEIEHYLNYIIFRV